MIVSLSSVHICLLELWTGWKQICKVSQAEISDINFILWVMFCWDWMTYCKELVVLRAVALDPLSLATCSPVMPQFSSHSSTWTSIKPFIIQCTMMSSGLYLYEIIKTNTKTQWNCMSAQIIHTMLYWFF